MMIYARGMLCVLGHAHLGKSVMSLSRSAIVRCLNPSPQSPRKFLAGSAALVVASVAGMRRRAIGSDTYARVANRTGAVMGGGGVGGGYDLCGGVLGQRMEELVPGLR